MLRIEIEKRLALIASSGAAAVTLLVTDRISTEPVNVGKMVLLTVVAFTSFSLIAPQLRNHIYQNKLLSLSGFLFLILGLASVFLSTNSWVKGFYGTFGRNTGFLTYFCLFLLLFTFAACSREQSYTRLINALYVAGIGNVIVSTIDILGGRLFTWDNPFNNVLGTFGNTNFISSFMGIFVTVLSAQMFKKQLSPWKRFSTIILMIISVLVIIRTESLQGLVITVVGISVTFYFFLVSQFKRRFLNVSYLIVIAVATLFGIFGMLQKGPLASVLYKPSVTFRGEYWASGMRMGFDHLLTGVGFDSYGTYYRLYRDSSAIISPGVNVGTDTAHNVFIDIFAGIGLIGFIGYLLLLYLVLLAAFKVIRRKEPYDFVFVALFSGWMAYQIQSFISINQIGLAVWGWILGGAIIGYSRMTRDVVLENSNSKTPNQAKTKKSQTEQLPAGTVVLMVISLAIGLLISIPPFVADAKMRTAVMSNQGERVAAAAKSWPLDSFRLNRAAVAFANSGLNATAIELSKISTKNFPEDYLGWFALYQLTADSDKSREFYKEKLNKIDPLNPEFEMKK